MELKSKTKIQATEHFPTSSKLTFSKQREEHEFSNGAFASLQMAVPNRHLDDKYHNADLTLSGFFVQRHYSNKRRTGTYEMQTANCCQDGHELKAQPLEQCLWKLEHRIQSDPPDQCHSYSSCSECSHTSLRSLVHESHSDPLPPEPDSDRTTGITHSQCLLKHQAGSKQDSCTSASSSYKRGDGKEITILSLNSQRSFKTQGTQTENTERGNEDGLAERLQTLEARVTLIETRISMLEKRDNEMI
jgi:hypothetical protein